MKRTLVKRLSLSYILIAVISVLLISILTNIFLQKQFKNYCIQVHESKSEDIVAAIDNVYTPEEKWNKNIIENVGVNALNSGLIVTVKDSLGNIVWDANSYNGGQCSDIISHMSENMQKLNHNWSGGFTKKEYPLYHSAKQIGTVEIGYYGPVYFSDNDLMFLSTLNKIFISVGIFSLCLALILGLLIARGISKPILRVIDKAGLISEGNYENIEEQSNIVEINKLISSINNLSKNLNKQEKLRKRLTGDVAHELRTPLATLQSHLEAIIDGVWQPTIDRIKSCHEEIMRLNRMVMDLERLAKFESENLVLNKTEFDLGEVINNIIKNFENQFTIKNVTLKFLYRYEIIYADKDKISQVIINLISNSLKYTEQGGRVEVTINDIKNNDISNNIQIKVSDNGIGISEEDLPYIFERFYRADKSRNRLTGGSGIGLTITKAIIEAHRGSINAKGKKDKGTEFIVSIPKK